MQQQQPVIVLNQKMERQTGRKAQLNNIEAARVVSGLISSTLGPCAMLKMILDPMGGTVLTNDGNCILREIDVVHPAAKHMLELARAQDEEVGDGTTSVIILTGEILSLSKPLLERGIHPLKIVKGFSLALTDALAAIEKIATSIDPNDIKQLEEVVRACLGTKYNSHEDDLMCKMAVEATLRVVVENKVTGQKEVDIKRYAKIEKIPGGSVSDSVVLDGVMFNKDHIHPKMRRYIEKPRILLLDCPLEYKKPETTINVEVGQATDWELLLKQEEDYVRGLCQTIISFKPDVVITEKGASDLAAHFLHKAQITCIRRLRKTDNNRIARATGATIISRVAELTEDHIGHAGLMEIKKIGDEYFTFITGCTSGKACSVVLRGASKDTINEMERNLHDAMCVARNIILEPRVVYGASALEMYVSSYLMNHSKSITGVQQAAYQAVAMALEVVPRILTSNCGANVIRTVTELRARHAMPDGDYWGVDGTTGDIVDVRSLRVVEPAAVKVQALKTAIEAASMILRVDDVVSGTKLRHEKENKPAPAAAQGAADDEQGEAEAA
ncbi:t-complex protein 1 gamma subunit, putative [Trypanosoma brucei gambiense DAL972]|uniref:T-complex protein 1 subunit gamma n=1 Tax=Trypanosoma brucei gambiense (strain MHOM/CI/86/DAL972) TaxID=679716 RepID=C9ZVA2_TRYB9|nr:t-complex protein 1 gamma subunit, putative [Trypanosoma brucei gambiense DAL972]CBH13340.1 t-complex protein 1 gamma subunit, putative [Trypanosoma brucei gambiense DAL972]|eukprot:XP_011775617.1 t-complex protein 1 gamma subunit, putative [Trypanosoma brucei gambiense DAL972]